MIPRLDPGLYFTPYTQQQRRLAVEYASGDPSSLRETFATPQYYQKPRMSHLIGTRFEIGLNVKNPASTRESMSFYSLYSNSKDLQMAMYNRMEKEAAIPEHVNLESPTGQYLKASMGLPYRAHSTVDPKASANFNPRTFRRKVLKFLDDEFERLFDSIKEDKRFFSSLDKLERARQKAVNLLNQKIDSYPNLRQSIDKFLYNSNEFIKQQEVKIPFEEDRYSKVSFPQVRNFFDELSEKYPDLIGIPRKTLRDYYEFSERMLYKGVISDNKTFSLLARTITYREYISRESNFLYLVDPPHLVNRILRSGLGVTNYKFDSIALHGLEVGSWERRFVKVAGITLGLYEAAKEYNHFAHKLGERFHNFEESRRTDPFETNQSRLDEKRRRVAYENWKKGKPYDPTQVSEDDAYSQNKLLSILHKFSPHTLFTEALDVVKHPGEHQDAMAGAAAYVLFAAPHVSSLYKTKEGTVLKRAFESILEFKKDPKLGYIGGIVGAAGFALPDFIHAKTWSARLGSLGLLASTLVAGKVGGEVGVQLITKSSSARSLAASGFKLFAKGATFMEHSYFDSSIEKWLHEAENLEKAEITPEFKAFARTLGQEFLGGEVAELSLGYLFTKWLRKIGKGIDNIQTVASNAAASVLDPNNKKEKSKRKRSEVKDYLMIQTAKRLHVKDAQAFLTPAYSKADILTNENYSNSQRAVLTVLKNTGFGDRVLKTASPIVTKYRRLKAAKEVVRLKVKSNIKSQDLKPDIRRIRKAYDRYEEYGHEGNSLNQDNEYSYG